MGIRINTAIGWGMPMAAFHGLCRIAGLPAPGGPGSWYEALEAALAHTADMRMSRWPLPVTGPCDTCLDLISLVGYDDYSDVLLYPSIGEARTWHRRDDDLDYALHWGPRSPGDHSTPVDMVEYLDAPLHPYGHVRMNPDGTEARQPVEEDQWDWERNPALLPGVPRTLRHWTLTSGLLDLEGIARLRPMRAIWWS